MVSNKPTQNFVLFLSVASLLFFQTFCTISFAKTESTTGSAVPAIGLPPSIERTGGPDSYGYTFIDTAETSCPAFSWVPLSSPTNLTMSGAAWSGSLDDGYYSSSTCDIGFTFPIYGTEYTTFTPCTNGYICLGSVGSTTFPSLGTWPNTTISHDAIGFWARDMKMNAASCLVKYQMIAGTPNKCVIEYDSLFMYGQNGAAYRLSAQIILFSTGDVEIQYRYVGGSLRSSGGGNIGLQNASGSNSITYASTQAEISTTPRVVYFAYPCNRISLLSPANGTANLPSNPLTLSWSGGPCTSGFDVYLDTVETNVDSSATAARILSNSVDTTYQFTPLFSHVYFWKVVARGTMPATMTSPIWSFNTMSAMTGTKTIGGAGADFASLSTALEVLASTGVGAGGVVFRIRDGTYTESPMSILLALDSSHPLTIAIDSGATVTYNIVPSGTDTWGIRLQSQYVNIDGSWNGDSTGKHLSFTGNALTTGIWFGDSSGYDTVKNCIIDIGIRSTTCYPVRIGIGATRAVTVTGTRLLHCDINGGYYGIYSLGNTTETTDSTYISNCNITNFYFYGAYFSYASHLIISHSAFYHTIPSANGTLYGLGLTTNVSNSLIDANRFGPLLGSATGSVYGIMAYPNTNVYSNNMINIGSSGSGAMFGIYPGLIIGSGNGCSKFLFNSINISGTTTASNSAGIYYATSTTAGDTLWGNIIQNTRTGGTTNYHTCLFVSSVTSVNFSDYNVLWVGSEDSTDNRYVARVGTTNYNTLANLTASTWTPRDQFSFSEPVPFVSDSDLHIGNTSSTAVESGAPHHWLVTTDFDGQARTNNACDIGADEGDFRRLAFGTLHGTVLDSNSARSPLEGVRVQAGRYVALTDVNGQYLMDVRSGIYNVVFSMDCFKTEMDSITIDSAETDSINVNMLHPELAPEVTSIELLAAPGQIYSSTLTIRNTGNSTLHWNASTITNSQFFSAHGGNVQPVKHIRDLAKVGNTGESNGGSLPTINQTWPPDSGGYRAMDSDEPGFPTLVQFRELRDIGTRVVGNDSAVSTPMDGFSFQYYGQTYTSIWVGANGFVQFAATGVSGTGTRTVTALPTSATQNCVLVLQRWDQTTVQKYYDANANVFYLQWSGTLGNFPSDSAVFELQLYGINNGLAFVYNNVATSNLTASIGIQNGTGASHRYLQCWYNNVAPFTHSLTNYAIAFDDGSGWPSWLSVSPTSGVLEPQEVLEVSYQVTVDSTVTVPAEWSGDLVFTSDACPATLRIPVNATITDAVRSGVSALPLQYKLYQNYPNPFNPTTEIRFDLKQPGLTRLSIHDVLGRQVAELVNRPLSAGYHSLHFNASRFASGVYFYRLESGKFSDVKKMVLVK